MIAEVDGLLEQFEFGKACEALYHFAWDEFCDWYLELTKVPLASGDERAAETTRRVLGFVLDQMLRLLHPVIPFVTDELWRALTGEDSVMVADWPSYEFSDPAAEAEIASLMRLVTEIRRFRSDQGLRPGQRVPARLAGNRIDPAGPPRGVNPHPPAANPARARLRALRLPRHRGRHRRTRPSGHRRHRSRTQAPGKGPDRGAARKRSRCRPS